LYSYSSNFYVIIGTTACYCTYCITAASNEHYIIFIWSMILRPCC